jgi:hypothetical protein
MMGWVVLFLLGFPSQACYEGVSCHDVLLDEGDETVGGSPTGSGWGLYPI